MLGRWKWFARGALALLGLTAVAPAAQAQSAAEFPLTVAPMGNMSATLSWSPQPGAVSYNVYAAQTVVVDPATAELPERPATDEPHPLERVAPGTWVEVVHGAQNTTLTLRDLPAEGTFALLVRPVDGESHEQGQSSLAQVSLAGAPGGSITADVPAVGTIDLTWHEVPGAARYALLVGAPGRALVPDARQQPVSTTGLRLTGVPPGTSWRFAVEAQDADGGTLARSDSTALVMPPPSAFGPPAIGPSLTSGIGP
ncbi:MAG TPA: hypothetical protein VFE37_01130 [Chloroflexota bacterium]|nr:hypothetical protein [Chloroflexota bacterium]